MSNLDWRRFRTPCSALFLALTTGLTLLSQSPPTVVLDDFSGTRANPGSPGENIIGVYNGEDPGQTYSISGGLMPVHGTPGVYWHFTPYPYTGVKGFAKGWIESGTWDPNINRLRLSFVCTSNIAKTSSGYGNVQIGTYVKRDDGNSSNQGAHFYHLLDPNVYAGKRVYMEINRTPQHQVGANGSTNWPEDPIASTVHYFDGLTRFYFDSQEGDWSNCTYSPVTFAKVTGEPDQQVSSVTYQYTGSRYEVTWSGPKNSSLKFDIAYSPTTMKTSGFASGGSGGVVSATGNDYSNVIWISGNLPEPSNGMYIAIRPQGQSGFTEVYVPNSGNPTPPPSDTAAPAVSITAPASSSTVSGSTTTVSASASDNVGVVGVQFKLDGVNLGAEDTTSPYSVTWNTTTATNADHTLTATARDAAGNTTTSTGVSITVSNNAPDVTAPTVSISSPGPNARVSGSAVSVTATASDNVSVAGVQFKLDGANLNAEDTSAPYAIVWNTTAATSGSHTLTAVARDAAGNSTMSAAVQVSVDNAAPSIAMSTPANGATVSGLSVTVSATASDNVGVAGVQFKLDGANLSAEDSNAPYSIVWNTTTAAAGLHTLTAVARDAAGNSAMSAATQVSVDNAAPSLAMSAPANGSTVSGSSVTVSATASDNVGVAGVQFKLDGANLSAEDSSAPYSIVWDTTTAVVGLHTLTAVARDAAGNAATSATVQVIVVNVDLLENPPLTLLNFDENAGPVAFDSSGNGLNGTLINGPFFGGGKRGNSILLNGSDQYVDLGKPAALQLTGSMTISAWVNASSFAHDDTAIVSSRTSANVGFQLDTTRDHGARTIGFRLTTSSGWNANRYGATTLQLGTWYYITGVYDAGARTMNVYLNGQLDNALITGTLTGAQQTSGLAVNLGRKPGSAYFEFAGAIDEVRIYNRALTQAEILSDMNAVIGFSAMPASTKTVTLSDLPSVTDLANSRPAAEIRVGHARFEAAPDRPLPAGLSILGFRSQSILTSETVVPASASVLSGRIYAGNSSIARTGIAIVNPNAGNATISYHFTDSGGMDFGNGTLELHANHQISAFLDEAPFNGLKLSEGTFTFNSSQPVAATALQIFTNERGEPIITSLPVSPLGETSNEAAVIPHFVVGDGWSTQVLLVNPTDSRLGGTVEFIDATSVSSVDYTVSPRSSLHVSPSVGDDATRVGWIRIKPTAHSITPSGVGILSYRHAGVLVTQSNVPATATDSTFRLLADSSGTPGAIGSVQTGIAIANAGGSPAVVRIEALTLDGDSLGISASMTIPAGGQVARFIRELLPQLPDDIRNVLRLTSTAPVALTGVRVTYNEREESILSAMSPWSEGPEANDGETRFPVVADGGGYATLWVFFSRAQGASVAGEMQVFSSDGTLVYDDAMQYMSKAGRYTLQR